jgi:hypothetical protein
VVSDYNLEISNPIQFKRIKIQLCPEIEGIPNLIKVHCISPFGIQTRGMSCQISV